MRYGEVWPAYAKMWDAMVINTNRRKEFEASAGYAIAHKVQYQHVEAASGVPWAMVAVIHRREGDGDFSTYSSVMASPYAYERLWSQSGAARFLISKPAR